MVQTKCIKNLKPSPKNFDIPSMGRAYLVSLIRMIRLQIHRLPVALLRIVKDPSRNEPKSKKPSH